MRRSVACLAALLMLGTPAHAFLAENGLVVEPAPDGAFEVPYRGLSGASDFWCAAGDYVIRELGRRPDTRIYRLTSPPRRSGQGITFSLASEGARRTGLLTFGDRRSVSASHARSLCDLPRLLDE